MGIDISFHGNIKTGLFNNITPKNFENILQTLVNKFDLQVFQIESGKYSVRFCPTGDLIFAFNEGNLEGYTQTSIAGPGFHKAATDFIDSLALSLGINLTISDDTAFWENRDFELLQQEHLNWLTTLINKIIEYPNNRFLISWPHESWKPAVQEFFNSPLACLTHSELKSIIVKGIPEFAKIYYLWYNSTKDALYHRGMALYYMWNEFGWVKPRDEIQSNIGEAILAHLQKAHELDPNLPLPIKEWDEVSGLLDKRIEVERNGNNYKQPENTLFLRKIGYRRDDLIHIFPGNWEVILPGHFNTLLEENGLCYWDDCRNFRMSIYEVQPPRIPAFPESILETCNEDEHLIELQVDDCQYRAKFYLFFDKELESNYWLLQGQILSTNSIAVVTITWSDETRTDWAVGTFKNIKGPVKQA